MRFNDAVALGIQCYRADRRPVPCGARPAPRISFAGLEIYLVTGGKDRCIFTRMTLRGTDVADAAVPVIMVVPMHEVRSPGASLIETGEAG